VDAGGMRLDVSSYCVLTPSALADRATASMTYEQFQASIASSN